ncbi:hypothetical protein [Williamsia sterculiae]|uniref:hypothetical protein n=1 Tax=Williamsia sterculiae TaxID=1344003 RepID=UPI0009703556|nr:hypothetical protein [Williamsia sterculiae]
MNTLGYIAAVPRAIIERLPQIAVATVSLALIWFSVSYVLAEVDKRNVVNAPSSNFLNYTSAIVNNSREGEDITYTLCRDHDQNYPVTGVRSVFAIPEGKTDKDRIFLYNKSIQGVVNDKCQSYLIKDSEHHFTPGRYQLTLNLSFKVKYDIEKSAYFKTNIFTVYPQPVGSSDLQGQIKALTQRVEALERRLGVTVTATPGAGQASAPASGETEPVHQNTATEPVTSASPSASPTTPAQSQAQGVPIITPLIDGVNGLLKGFGL